MKKIKVYLSARISEDAHDWNDATCDLLDDRFEVFEPREHNPHNIDHRNLGKRVYETNLDAMKDSDMCLLLSPYGNDCSWEVGWYSKSDKPVVLFVGSDNSWLRDWMVKGGVDWIICYHDWYADLLERDHIVHDKVKLIEKREQLSDVMVELYENSLPKK